MHLASQGNALTGFATGFIESVTDGVLSLYAADAAGSSPNLSLQLDPKLNRLFAEMTLDAKGLFSFQDQQGPDVTLSFGGFEANSSGMSAYVEREKFGARLSGAALATAPLSGAEGGFVTGKMLKDGLPTDIDLCDCRFVDWGFFFADYAPAEKTREHIHLGTWVAGQQSPTSALAALAARDIDGLGWKYEGHAVGQVYAAEKPDAAGAYYTAFGTFVLNAVFGKATGKIDLTFDATDYEGGIDLTNLASNGFSATLLQAGATNKFDGRTGTLDGRFFGPEAESVGGQFHIESTPIEARPEVYSAAGVFAGDRTAEPGD